MEHFTELAIQTALRKMFASNWFDICTIDSCLQLAGIPTGGKVHDLLRTLHCVHYTAMPRELRDQLPNLVRELFDFPAFADFTLRQPAIDLQVLEAPASASTSSRPRGFVKRLLGNLK